MFLDQEKDFWSSQLTKLHCKQKTKDYINNQNMTIQNQNHQNHLVLIKLE